jgi:hypothetical protein
MGHILLLNYPDEFAGDFLAESTVHFQEERQRIENEQRPPAYEELIERLYALWSDMWVWEFASDMIATYLVGPPYGWQHLRLCASLGGSAYFPSLGEIAEHPADEARMQGIRSVLQRCGSRQEENDIRRLW